MSIRPITFNVAGTVNAASLLGRQLPDWLDPNRGNCPCPSFKFDDPGDVMWPNPVPMFGRFEQNGTRHPGDETHGLRRRLEALAQGLAGARLNRLA